MLVAALAPAALPALLPCALAGAAVALATALLPTRAAAGATADATVAHASQGPLRLREALVVAALLAAVSLLVSLAQQRLGAVGLLQLIPGAKKCCCACPPNAGRA